ncbi:hypothetical protein [Nonomuraea sp. NPDC049158]|uniref:hypothetical protein n=1 Tax=Nonomuraea sp. NPDC049158 TaxID=3155649 RepID=UPI0033ED7F68
MDRSVRAATALMWSILPFGAIVTALNIAVCASVEAVARKALSQSRDYLDYGMAHFDTVAWGRTQGIAVFFILAALAIGAIAWLIRRQRRFNLVALLVGPLSLTYVFWVWHVHMSNPVADDVLWKIQEFDPALPLTSDTLLPGWYQPTLTVTLLAAAAAQLSALALLIWSRALRRNPAEGGMWRGRILALTGPACAAAYAAINFTLQQRAGRPPGGLTDAPDVAARPLPSHRQRGKSQAVYGDRSGRRSDTCTIRALARVYSSVWRSVSETSWRVGGPEGGTTIPFTPHGL